MAKKTEAKAAKSKAPKTVDFSVLVIGSKVKKYIKQTDEMRTSGDVKTALTVLVKKVVDNAIELAQSDNMKTVQGKHIAAAVKALNAASVAPTE